MLTTSTEPKMTEPEAPEFKVFVGNIPYNATEADLVEHFSSVGPVLSAKVIKRYEKSVGFGFVSFQDPESVQTAIETMSHTEFNGREINVELATPEGERKPREDKKRAPRHPKAASAPAAEPIVGADDVPADVVAKKRKPRKKRAPKPQVEGGEVVEAKPKPVRINRYEEASNNGKLSQTTIYVGNLPYHITDSDLGLIFEEYEVENAFVAMDPTLNRSKGFGFVTFTSEPIQTKVLGEVRGAVCDDRNLVIRAAITDMIARAHDPIVPRTNRRKVKPMADAEEGSHVFSQANATGNGAAEEAY